MKSGVRPAALSALLALSILSVSMSAWSESLTRWANPAKKTDTVQEKARKLFWNELAPEPDEDVITQYYEGKLSRKEAMAYLDKLGKTAVKGLDQNYVRVPGYLVPLNLNSDKKATELLLVPTMGSCIHVPPPPPNQTVFITFDKGIEVEEAGYTAYWVTGTITLERQQSEYTETMYTMSVDRIERYKDEY